MTIGRGLADDLGGLLLIQEFDGIIPAAGLAAIFQCRLRRPGQIGRLVGGLLGILPRCLMRAEALGFEIEAAQPELARFRIIGHLLELLTSLVMLAFDQGGLGLKQVDERLLISADEAAGASRHLASQQRIASPGRDQAGRQCLIAAIALAGAEIAGDGVWRGPDQPHEPPDDHHRGHDRNQDRGGNDELRLVKLAFPDQREIAGPIRQPGKAIAESQDENGEDKQSDHCCAPSLEPDDFRSKRSKI